eukprot:7215908-Alexandrium_andersonii.AAC.1
MCVCVHLRARVPQEPGAEGSGDEGILGIFSPLSGPPVVGSPDPHKRLARGSPSASPKSSGSAAASSAGVAPTAPPAPILDAELGSVVAVTPPKKP